MQLSEKTTLMIMERIMKRDALLQPYFEDGIIQISDRPEEGEISFRPGVSAEIRKFILDRIRILRGAKPEEWDREKYEKWQEREEMIKNAESDEYLAWYFKEGYLKIEKAAEECGMWLDDKLPEEEKSKIQKKVMEIWVGEEVDDEVLEMARNLMAEDYIRPPAGLGTDAAVRDLVIEALREDEMISEYIEAGLIKLNTDPTLDIWEIDKSVSMGEVEVLHNMGIYVLINQFGIDPDSYFQSKPSEKSE